MTPEELLLIGLRGMSDPFVRNLVAAYDQKSPEEVLESAMKNRLKAIEELARRAAPDDSNHDAFPNFSDTDIWIAGYVSGFTEALTD